VVILDFLKIFSLNSITDSLKKKKSSELPPALQDAVSCILRMITLIARYKLMVWLGKEVPLEDNSHYF